MATVDKVSRLSASGCVRQRTRNLAWGIKRELIPLDPSTATALAEAFIEADEVFWCSSRADDSDSTVGDRKLRVGQLGVKSIFVSRDRSRGLSLTVTSSKSKSSFPGSRFGARDLLLPFGSLRWMTAMQRLLPVAAGGRTHDHRHLAVVRPGEARAGLNGRCKRYC